ncbi:MAG TPA: hypothetical protein VIR02_14875 [Anaerolineales bacterium]
MMRKVIILAAFFMTGCGLLPTPNDFPPPPVTVIVEIPQVTATTTLEPRMRPILPDDLQDAETVFLIVKTSMAAGDDVRIAESVKYPIRVTMDGQSILLKDPREFLDQYETIFDQDFITTLFEMDETNLTLLPNGIQVGNGELWFNYFCVDPSCSDAQFRITQINR